MVSRTENPSRLMLSVIAAFIFGALVAGLAMGRIGRDRTVTSVGPPQCVGFEENGGRFVPPTEGMTYTGIIEANEGRGVVYRRQANALSDYDVRGRLLPANCKLGFVGFCIGQPLQDFTNLQGPWEQQWFVLPEGKGFIHGGVVQEFAPGTIGKEPMNCEKDGGEPEPQNIELVQPIDGPVSGTIPLTFSAPNAINVGVALYRLNGNGQTEWEQVAFKGLGAEAGRTDEFAMTWEAQALPPQRRATLLYTVCWGGNVPGRARGEVAVDVAQNGTQEARVVQEPTPEQLRQGAAVACSGTSGGQ